MGQNDPPDRLGRDPQIDERRPPRRPPSRIVNSRVDHGPAGAVAQHVTVDDPQGKWQRQLNLIDSLGDQHISLLLNGERYDTIGESEVRWSRIGGLVSYPIINDWACPWRYQPKHGIRDVWPTDKGPLSRSSERLYMRQAHTTMNLLPSGGFPARTVKIQFLTCLPTVSTAKAASCLAQEQVYHNWQYLAIGSGKRRWAKAAQAGRFLPRLKLVGLRA